MTDAPLLEAAQDARLRAYAPYSKFQVGAAIRAASGQIYTGGNVENASYPEGWCAETSAIAAMIAAGEREIAAVCVTGDVEGGITPCGGCRQRLAEFAAAQTQILCADLDAVRRTVSMAELLPHAFNLETS